MQLDHLAVAGESLEAAATHLEAALGLPLQAGGAHARFGTHNRLLGLEDGLYLEAIAIDPAAPAPDRARWFDLDRLQGPPHLRTWIARVDDLDAALTRHPDAGTPLALERGDLRWRMAVPASGILPFDNLFPALIEWQGTAHPAQRLAPSGARLTRLVIAHPDAVALRDVLSDLADPRVVIEPGTPALRAEITTPHGSRVLE
ncbi:VOC family protein [Roseovarius autotrophicus]|uniref:VOC family protein n=1 Tax=Roseovarius autotrophicus TaxID=2824121 RepID=UPI0019E508DC|nr:VOC family protein [Roseovarius autotrophicus]MBE0453500.1 VOC family protein [Roseovarius sp.]